MTSKNKLIIGISVLVIGLAGFLFGRLYLNKADKPEIQTFLQTFSQNLVSKPADSLLLSFEVKQSRKDIIRILNLLAGHTSINGKLKPLFKTVVNVDNAVIIVVNESLSRIAIPLTLVNSKFPDYPASLNITLRKDGKNRFMITEINGEELFSNFVAFENAIRTKMHSEDEIFSEQTLLAFKKADQLKSKYDSVLWFSYVNDKPFYYVINGKWDFYASAEDIEKAGYKMGLVNADLKEIIPAEFDLVHNIGGTLEGLIEVEKGGKRGFYDLQGRNVIPVINDQVIPVSDSVNIAVASVGSDYYWIRKDYSISDRDTSIKIADVLKKIKLFNDPVHSFTGPNTDNLLEFNSREEHAALYLPPSYLVNWNFLPKTQLFKNPLRKNVEYNDISSSIDVTYTKTTEPSNWLETAFYSIRDNYIGGRTDFYDTKNVLLVDHKSNKVYSYQVGIDAEFLLLNCNEFKSKAIADNLFEITSSNYINLEVNDKYLNEIPSYHYLSITDGKMEELPNRRYFGFTKYIKMDDSYIKGCYTYDGNEIHTLPKAILTYLKMEIYADHNYRFPDEHWVKTFESYMADYKPENASVESELTDIDRYNIKWIDQKLNNLETKKLAKLVGSGK